MEVSLPVTIIGAGNMAWHLAPALENVGYTIKEVFARDSEQAKQLIGNLYNAAYHPDLDFSESEAQIFLLAVSDSAIESIAQEIILPENAIILHTSGSIPMNILSYTATDHYGVFYPLQTFSKRRRLILEGVPVCIEASTDRVHSILKAMGQALSQRVIEMETENRQILHLAAVFANNFTNHMVKISGDILSAHSFPPDLLYPLISETMNKMMQLGSDHSQTGPARRHDYKTLEKHMNLLRENDDLLHIYRLLSQHIADTYPIE